jgi:hypothetical protein
MIKKSNHISHACSFHIVNAPIHNHLKLEALGKAAMAARTASDGNGATSSTRSSATSPRDEASCARSKYTRPLQKITDVTLV